MDDRLCPKRPGSTCNFRKSVPSILSACPPVKSSNLFDIVVEEGSMDRGPSSLFWCWFRHWCKATVLQWSGLSADLWAGGDV